jgi:transcription initiation factor TFIID subunit 2
MVTASEPAAPLSPGLQGLGYTVSHQKLELEIDFATKSLKGKTDITIQPTQADLKGVRLNCRLNKVTRQTINGHATIIKYQDPFANLSLPEGTTVHQHHQLRQKIAGSFKDPADGEFWAILPKGVHIEEANPTPTDTQNASAAKVVPGEAKRGSEDAGASLPTAVSKSAEEPIVRYTPITLSIEFETQEFRDGLQFIGCEEGDQRYPHAYTRVLPAPGSACSIFPCIDDASARCTWDIVIKYPRTLADIFPPQTPGSASDADDATPTSPANPAGSIDDEASDASSDEEDDVVEARPAGDGGMEMSVVCSGELVEEVSHCVSIFISLVRAPSYQSSQGHRPVQPGEEGLDFCPHQCCLRPAYRLCCWPV